MVLLSFGKFVIAQIAQCRIHGGAEVANDFIDTIDIQNKLVIKIGFIAPLFTAQQFFVGIEQNKTSIGLVTQEVIDSNGVIRICATVILRRAWNKKGLCRGRVFIFLRQVSAKLWR